MWNPLAFILSLVFPCIEYFDASLLIKGLCLNHSYLSFLYLCGHLFARSWPSSTWIVATWVTSAKSWSYFSRTLLFSLQSPLLCRNCLPWPSLNAFLLKMSIPTFSSSLVEYPSYSIWCWFLPYTSSTGPWLASAESVELYNSLSATSGSSDGSTRSYLIATCVAPIPVSPTGSLTPGCS